MYIIIKSKPEIWKIIDDEDVKPIYKISNYGRVMNIETQKLLTLQEDKDGYYDVTLMRRKDKRDGTCRMKKFRVCRLVAKAFIPNPDNKPTVNHLDGDHKNDYEENLEWATFSEQIQHAIAEGLRADFRGSKNPASIYDDEFIHNICKCFENGLLNTEDIMKKLNKSEDFYKNKKPFIKLFSKLRCRTSHSHITKLYKY